MFHDPVEDGFEPYVPVTEAEVRSVEADLVGSYKGGGLKGVCEEYAGLDARLSDHPVVIGVVKRLTYVASAAHLGVRFEDAALRRHFKQESEQ